LKTEIESKAKGQISEDEKVKGSRKASWETERQMGIEATTPVWDPPAVDYH
jgi:hypothetical protein